MGRMDGGRQVVVLIKSAAKIHQMISSRSPHLSPEPSVATTTQQRALLACLLSVFLARKNLLPVDFYGVKS